MLDIHQTLDQEEVRSRNQIKKLFEFKAEDEQERLS